MINRVSSTIVFALAMAATGSAASACTQGAKCVAAQPTAASFAYQEGDTLPRGKYNVVLNTEYHGLPATDGSFWYFRVEGRILRVNPASMRVMGAVNR